MRTPSDFYSDQKKFIEKKGKIIEKLSKDKIEGEEKNKKATMVSKNSEKIVNNKNPNETLEQFCKRLAEERLRNKKGAKDEIRSERTGSEILYAGASECPADAGLKYSDHTEGELSPDDAS